MRTFGFIIVRNVAIMYTRIVQLHKKKDPLYPSSLMKLRTTATYIQVCNILDLYINKLVIMHALYGPAGTSKPLKELQRF